MEKLNEILYIYIYLSTRCDVFFRCSFDSFDASEKKKKKEKKKEKEKWKKKIFINYHTLFNYNTRLNTALFILLALSCIFL